MSLMGSSACVMCFRHQSSVHGVGRTCRDMQAGMNQYNSGYLDWPSCSQVEQFEERRVAHSRWYSVQSRTGQWWCDVMIVKWIYYRSCCHGNRHLNNDSKSQRSISIASRMILNLIGIHGRQSAHDDKSHTCTYAAGRVWVRLIWRYHSHFIDAVICTVTAQTITSVLSRWPTYKEGLRAGSKGV